MNYERLYRDAQLMAIHAHQGQTYDEVYPYEKHLIDVVDVIIKFGFSGKYIIAAWLHDIMEDTSISYNKLKRIYGEEVAEMVYCVTDELGRDREEKKSKTLPKTASNSDAIIIKLADRIANIQHGGKIGMYASEFHQFKNMLYANTPKSALPMWDLLEVLLKIEKIVA